MEELEKVDLVDVEELHEAQEEPVQPKEPKLDLNAKIRVSVGDGGRLGKLVRLEVGNSATLLTIKGARDIALALRQCANVIEKANRGGK